MRKRFSKILFGFVLSVTLIPNTSILGGPFEDWNQSQINRVLMDASDFQVNQENYPSTFDQTTPSVAVFKDGSFVIVWQDERNGDWDIYAQKFDSSGAAIGSNFEIPEKTVFTDQLNPDVARLGDSSFIVVWVEEEEQNIYAQRFNPDLSPIGSLIQINEIQIPTPDLKPTLATFPDGGFAVVWQDTRVGINIYARKFDSSGNPLGSSFKVNDGTSILPESPSISADTSGVFIIVWNDSRDGDKDIYFQRYDSYGSPVDTNIIANTDVGTEVQYQPRVTFGKNRNFIITWIDLRNGNEDIYARLFSWDGEAKIADMKVNSDLGTDGQWSPDVGADSNGYFTIAWADYRGELPAMYVQKYDTNGIVLGPNMRVSDSTATGENQMTSIWVNEPGDYVVCWRYAEEFSFDVYAQMVSLTGMLKGSNFKVNDDETGAMQKLPQVATDQNGGMLAVWEEQRRGNLKDASDIYVKKFNHLGVPVFGEFQVNDNPELIPQKFPDITVARLGESVVVWQDSRNGQNIYGQRIDRNGNLQGENFQVNRYQGLSVSLNPSCAISSSGKFVVVWCGLESAIKNIYAQLFESSGNPIDSSFKVNDDGQAVEHLYPRVAMDHLGSFVVAWFDRRDSQERIFIQMYNSLGIKKGDNFALDQDMVNPVEQEFDLDMNDDGTFVLVWIESRSSSGVYAQIYDPSGNSQGSNILVTDDTLSSPQDPKVSVDNDTFFVVTWTDQRDGNPNIYYQKFYLDGTLIDSNMIIHDPENSLQISSDNGVSVTYLYTVWMDNRTSGHGFDIYANVITYRPEVGVEEEFADKFISQFNLSQNYPNPFNFITTIPFTVHGKQKTVNSSLPTTLFIYNVLGQKVKTLVDQNKSPGNYTVIWDGRDDSGDEVSSGVYLYQLKSGNQQKTKKLLYLK
jgi:hypothetical protein